MLAAKIVGIEVRKTTASYFACRVALLHLHSGARAVPLDVQASEPSAMRERSGPSTEVDSAAPRACA